MSRSRGSDVRVWASAVFAVAVTAASPVRAQSQAVDPSTASPTAAPVQPQPSTTARPWTLAVRGGAVLSSNSSSGTSQLPAGLSSIASGPGSPNAPARAVSSWFFGDGAEQLNGAAGAFGIPRMSPLDTVLESPGVHYGPTGGVGATLSRELTPRWAVDVNLDIDLRSNALSSLDDSTIEQVRSGFVTTWKLFLKDLGANIGAVAATRTGTTSSGRQLDATAMLTYQLGRAASKTRPFVEFGGGVSTMTGGSLSATLTGIYAGSVLTTPPVPCCTLPFQQTDSVTIHWQNGGTRPVGVVGAGLDRALSATQGFRAQVRVVFGSNHQETTLDAAPSTPSYVTPAVVGIFTRDGSVLVPDSLNGPSFFGFKTFSASGLRIETTLSMAYYFRFSPEDWFR